MSSATAVVAAHGALADGLVSAVDAITGRGAVLRAVSNAGLSLAGVMQAIGDALDTTGARIVFTDLPAGSCTLAARKLQRDRADLVLVIGVNLPMLLEFVMREGEPGTTAPARASAAADRGREHIRVLEANRGG